MIAQKRSMTLNVYVLILAWLSAVHAYVTSRCNYRYHCGTKAADDDWGSISSESIEEYENLLDLSSSIEPTKSTYNFLLDELTIAGNDKKENNTGIYSFTN